MHLPATRTAHVRAASGVVHSAQTCEPFSKKGTADSHYAAYKWINRRNKVLLLVSTLINIELLACWPFIDVISVIYHLGVQSITTTYIILLKYNC